MTLARAAGGVVVAAVAAATLAARHASPADVSPVTPHGAWGPTWRVGVLVALAAYGLGTWLCRRERRVAAVLVASVVIQAAPLAAPLLLSRDVFLYWSQARVFTVHGGNPYHDSPSRYPGDPSLPQVSPSWLRQPTVYGPVWELASTAPAGVAGSSPHRAELAYRVLAVLAVLAAVALVARATRSAAATAFVGWNPLVAFHFAGGGHNDALLAVLLALAATSTGAGGGASYAASTLYKAFPGFLVPLELARVRLRPRTSFWLGLVGAAVALGAVAFGLFGATWVGAMLSGASTPSGLGGVHWLEQLGLRYRYAVVTGALVFASVYVALLRHAWRRGRARLSLATSALCLTAAQLRPWYALWPVVLAGAEDDALASVVAYGLTAYLLLADAIRL